MNFTPRKRTTFIAVHCAATRASQDIGETEIAAWHKARGWQDIGYNIVIRRDGIIEIGRPLDYRGAHVQGYNDSALGICLVGGINDAGQPADNFTAAQKDSLVVALEFCRRYARGALIRGHRDFPGVRKACPSFDVRAWLTEVAPHLL